MKRTAFYLALSAILTFMVVCCEEDTTSFDQTLLYGKWQGTWESKVVYYKFFDDETGYTWVPADDVTEEEATTFTWTLVQAEFTQIYVGTMGQTVPKVYTVDELTASTLKYHDDFDTYSFTKAK
jgi:hypothetical protein